MEPQHSTRSLCFLQCGQCQRQSSSRSQAGRPAPPLCCMCVSKTDSPGVFKTPEEPSRRAQPLSSGDRKGGGHPGAGPSGTGPAVSGRDKGHVWTMCGVGRQPYESTRSQDTWMTQVSPSSAQETNQNVITPPKSVSQALQWLASRKVLSLARLGVSGGRAHRAHCKGAEARCPGAAGGPLLPHASRWQGPTWRPTQERPTSRTLKEEAAKPPAPSWAVSLAASTEAGTRQRRHTVTRGKPLWPPLRFCASHPSRSRGEPAQIPDGMSQVRLQSWLGRPVAGGGCSRQGFLLDPPSRPSDLLIPRVASAVPCPQAAARGDVVTPVSP